MPGRSKKTRNTDMYEKHRMADQALSLYYKTPDGHGIQDCDTVLADLMAKADFEISGLGPEIIKIWQNSSDKNSVEDLFMSFTDTDFAEYLRESINRTTTADGHNRKPVEPETEPPAAPRSDKTPDIVRLAPHEQSAGHMYEMKLKFKADCGLKSLDGLVSQCGFHDQGPSLQNGLILYMTQTVPFIPDDDTLKRYAQALEESYNKAGSDTRVSNIRFDGYEYLYMVGLETDNPKTQKRKGG